MPITRKDLRGTRKNQCARLLAPLIEAHGAWVGLPTILALGIAQYNSRIHELRRAGFEIENKTERAADGTKHSYFCLLCGTSDLDTRGNAPKVQQRHSPTSQTLPQLPATGSGLLFDDIPSERYPD